MRLFLLACVLAPVLATAAPQVGEKFPVIRGEDARGQPQTTGKFRGQPTLIIAISDRNAGDAMRAWFETADKRMKPEVKRLSIISLSLPFFVGVDKVRSKAREQIPEKFWGDNLIDARGELARKLGIGGDKAPWVFVVDPQGQVVAQFKGPVTAPGADAIWDALKGMGHSP